MKFNSLLKFLFFLAPVSVFAQANEAKEVRSYAPTAAENALLWEISGKDLESPSFLFGTIHLIGKEDFVLSDSLKHVFGKSGKVIFEIDTEDMFDLEAQFSLLMRSFMDEGVRLRDLVSKEDYTLVEDHFKKIGLPLMFLERVKPMILSVFAAEDFGQGSMGSGSMKSYEIELTKMANLKKAEIEGLETMDYQMSMFDSIPYKVQAQMLVESIRSGTTGDEEYKKMVELYKSQDLLGMQAMVMSESGGMGDYNDLLIVNRNKNWIPLMEKAMNGQTVFFAVGAGHLAGEDGVIALLRKEGYILRPIRQ